MKKIFVIAFYCFLLVLQTSAQKLNLSDFINSALGKGYSTVDTLYYVVGECSPFFDSSCSNNNNRIKIVYFRNEKEMSKRLPMNDSHKFLLEINISDISTSSLIMNVSISKTNNKMFTGERSFVIFFGKQIVECKLTDEKKWVYFKTLDFKGHITD